MACVMSEVMLTVGKNNACYYLVFDSIHCKPVAVKRVTTLLPLEKPLHP